MAIFLHLVDSIARAEAELVIKVERRVVHIAAERVVGDVVVRLRGLSLRNLSRRWLNKGRSNLNFLFFILEKDGLNLLAVLLAVGGIGTASGQHG